MDDHHQIGRCLAHGYAETAYVLGQSRLGHRDAVLHEHLRLIDIGPGLEDNVDRQPPVAGRLRHDVEHVVDAIHLLLNRCGDCLGDDLCRRTRVGRAMFTVGGAISGYSAIGRNRARSVR